MITGCKVVRLSEAGASVFVGLKADDGLAIELQFRAGDRRVDQFRFGASVMVEVNSVLLQRAIDLVEVAS